MIVIRVRAEFELAEQPGVDEFREGAVYRRAANIQPGRLQVPDQLFGREMMVLGENVMNKVPLLAGEPLRAGPAAEILPEFVFRRLRRERQVKTTNHLLGSASLRQWDRTGVGNLSHPGSLSRSGREEFDPEDIIARKRRLDSALAIQSFAIWRSKRAKAASILISVS